MLYILSSSYSPNTAVTNHALSFIKGFDELGVKAEWIFINPDNAGSKLNVHYNSVNVRYLWKKLPFNDCKIKTVLRIIYTRISLLRFILLLKPDDIVLLLGVSEYVYLFSKLKKIKVFHERTEHPDVVKVSNNVRICKRYLDGCRRISGIFLISKNLCDYYKSIGVDENKAHVINMVVDTSRFLDLKKQVVISPYIAYCGHIQNSKDGADILLKAFYLVHQKYPALKLYIIGPCESGSENYDVIENLKLSDSVIMTGAVPASEMPQLLKNAMALALARPESKQAKYGFPTKLGEYLLTKNPVVVTSVGNIPDFLHDYENALVAAPNDVVSFSERLIWVIEHPEGASVIGRKGCEVAEKNFNYLTETKKMVDIMFK